MQPTVGVAPGTLTLMMQGGLGQSWAGPGGPIPVAGRELQARFMTSPFTPPASTTPIVYLGAGPPPGTPLCIPGTPGYGMASIALQGVVPTRKTALIVGLALGLAALGVGIGAALSVEKKPGDHGVDGANWSPDLQKAYQAQKAALTRAKKAGPQAVIKAVDAFFAFYEAQQVPAPDDWARWERAKDDAQSEIRRQG